MFTGIVSDVGRIAAVEARGDLRVTIETGYDTATVDLGASISCSGVCLTVVDRAPGRFTVDVSGETLARTAPGQWAAGRPLNLERAMRLGDEMGGHIVTGHVDGVAEVTAIEPAGGSQQVTLAAPAALAPYLAAKGSVTIDGVSLTVNAVTDAAGAADAEGGDARATAFTINLIPHTRAVTTLGGLQVGQGVNVEIDVLARYLRRMEQYRGRPHAA